MRNIPNPDPYTTQTFLDQVISQVPCGRHSAGVNEPCMQVDEHRAICNKRAIRAGFNHRISEKSLRLVRNNRR